MFLRTFFLCLFLGLVSIKPAKTEVVPVILGDTTVKIEQVFNGRGKAFFHVHQNETTALKAARTVVSEAGGSVLTLHHPGGRNIVFHMKGVRYEFDPNRMFTDAGIKKTLNRYGAYSKEAHTAVQKLARGVTALLPQDQKVIAVHNNSTYSLREYYKGHALHGEAKALHVASPGAYRNFYLATQAPDYMKLKKTGFNALLQAPAAEDDGSLSIYLVNKPYVNVEAAYGALNEQIQMLKMA